MHRLVLTTDDVPEADRFAYWREEFGEAMLGFSGEHKFRGAQLQCANHRAIIVQSPLALIGSASHTRRYVRCERQRCCVMLI